jgi:hypothetical protein
VCTFLQVLAGLEDSDLELVKSLMHGSLEPAKDYRSAPWLFDIVSVKGHLLLWIMLLLHWSCNCYMQSHCSRWCAKHQLRSNILLLLQDAATPMHNILLLLLVLTVAWCRCTHCSRCWV